MEIDGVVVQDTYFYKDMNLSEAIMKALDKKGYVRATPVQAGAFLEESVFVPYNNLFPRQKARGAVWYGSAGFFNFLCIKLVVCSGLSRCLALP